MSVRASSWVWDNAPKNIGASELVLLLALADEANDQGRAFPSLLYLARKMRAHVDTVKRNMNALIQQGLVERQERSGHSNVYRLIMLVPSDNPPAVCTPPQTTPGSVAGGSGPQTPPQVAHPPANDPPASDPHIPKTSSGQVRKQTHLPGVGGAGGEQRDDAQAERTDSQTASARPKRNDQGTRLPENWTPPVASRQKMLQKYPGRPNEWWLTETERFMNHFGSAPGQRGRKTDWPRTWENWIHKAIELEPARRRSNGRQSPNEAAAQGLSLVSRLEAQEAAERGSRQPTQAEISGGAA